jgi:SAM-dependent methyltransferase
MTVKPDEDAGERRLRELINGFRSTAIVYTAIELDLPERLADRPVSADTLARDLDLRPDYLHRLLRAMTGLGLCEEIPDGGTFSLTGLGAHLRKDSSSPLREYALIAVEQYSPAWAGLADTLRNGRPAFENLHGTTIWQARAANPRLGSTFSLWLSKETARAARLIAAAVDPGSAARVADIGCGLGELMAEILHRNPHVTGILFDRTEVIDAARVSLASSGLEGRLEYAAGDFFDAIPVRADLYIMKSVLHDWNDEEVGAILRRCRAAMAPGARLLVVERALPPSASDDLDTILLDMHMMAVTGGKERYLQDYLTLLEREGFTVSRTERAAHFSLIDARTE